MHRITMTIDDDLMAELDRFMSSRNYQNRSEALRDLARAGIESARDDSAMPGDEHVAALVYVYDHDVRELSKRLAKSYHDHHAASVATLHVHLDAERCMEVAVLRGRAGELHTLAARVIAERGVRYGRLVLAPLKGDGPGFERHSAGAPHSHETANED